MNKKYVLRCDDSRFGSFEPDPGAWQNFYQEKIKLKLKRLDDRDSLPQRIDLLKQKSNECLKEFNGKFVYVANGSSCVEFDTEKDLEWFILRWG